MNLHELVMVLGAVLLAGCGTTRNVAVSSYHVTRDVAVGSYRVATAPVHYALRRHSNEPTMVGTTDAVESDVTQPGHPAASTQVASAPQPRRKTETTRSQTTRSQKPAKTTQPVTHTDTTEPELKPAATQASSTSSTFPTAKAVPDKPGYVFSPFDSSGRYVDVSGYTPGTKVKDPWTDKIFVVP
jgi:septal ring-binding cell division protein DamX